MDNALARVCDAMDSAKNSICLLIPALTFPPAFDNALVVTIQLEVISWCAHGKECLRQELKPNGFHPSNVTSIRLLSWEELPCSPPVTNGDSNADTRAGIGVSLGIDDLMGLWDGSSNT